MLLKRVVVCHQSTAKLGGGLTFKKEHPTASLGVALQVLVFVE